jgi:hypothetical protein
MAPPCSRTNRRFVSPGGAARNTGELRVLAMVWSFRVVEAGELLWVSPSPPHAARRLKKHTQRLVHRMTFLMDKLLSDLRAYYHYLWDKILVHLNGTGALQE